MNEKNKQNINKKKAFKTFKTFKNNISGLPPLSRSLETRGFEMKDLSSSTSALPGKNLTKHE